MKEWRELLRTHSTREETPMKPQVVAAALDELLARRLKRRGRPSRR